MRRVGHQTQRQKDADRQTFPRIELLKAAFYLDRYGRGDNQARAERHNENAAQIEDVQTVARRRENDDRGHTDIVYIVERTHKALQRIPNDGKYGRVVR